MPFVLDLDPSALRKLVREKPLVQHRARRAEGAVKGGDVVPAALADRVGGFETVAGQVEIVTRHGVETREAGIGDHGERPAARVDLVPLLSILVPVCY